MSAHMQAVAGFDRARSTILLRDPGQPYTVEVPARHFSNDIARSVRMAWFSCQWPSGRVWMASSSRTRMSMTSGTASGWRWRSTSALLGRRFFHKRKAVFPTRASVGAAAGTCGIRPNTKEQLQYLDKLLELFPNNPARQLRRLGCMRDAPRDERIQFLEQACAAESVAPALLVELARTLRMDARCVPRARDCIRRAFRLSPMASNTMTALADLEWQEGRLDEATELYRFAANLEGFREPLPDVVPRLSWNRPAQGRAGASAGSF